jgi:hypothetical protein
MADAEHLPPNHKSALLTLKSHSGKCVRFEHRDDEQMRNEMGQRTTKDFADRSARIKRATMNPFGRAAA